MAKQPTAQIAEATSEALTKSGAAAEKIMEGNAEALTESGNSSGAAIQELTKAYQELAAKNAKNLTAAMPLPDGRSRREADIAVVRPIIMAELLVDDLRHLRHLRRKRASSSAAVRKTVETTERAFLVLLYLCDPEAIG